MEPQIQSSPDTFCRNKQNHKAQCMYDNHKDKVCKSKQIPTGKSLTTKDVYHRVSALQGSLEFLNAALLKAGDGRHFWTGRQNKHRDGSKKTNFIKLLTRSVH